jgi:hypothetical protein
MNTTKTRHYYVSVIQDSITQNYRLLRGPYTTHQKALDVVDETRKKAEELDYRAWSYAFGTMSFECENPPQGKLNRFFENNSKKNLCQTLIQT